MPKERLLVSACLLGLHTRYDGEASPDPRVISLGERFCLIPVCPEQLGGLPTPRPPCELNAPADEVVEGRGKVLEVQSGVDRTREFLRGASETLALARLLGVRRALLKDGSPSCGVTYIKRGGQPVSGRGITTELLTREGIAVEGY